MSAGTVAKMLWGNPEQPVAAPTPAGPAPVAPITQDLFTFGLPQGFTQKDLGDGRYEMFDASGNSAGYGYKGVRDAIAEIGLNNAKSQTRNTNVDRWFAENPNATPEQIYEAASKYGVSSDLIDQARGAYKGATDEWVKSKGLAALTGTDAFRNGGGWENSYLKVAKSIWTDIDGKEIDVSGLQRELVFYDSSPQDTFFKPAPTDAFGNQIGEREQVYAKQVEKMVNQDYDSLAGLNNDLSGLVASKQKYFGGAMGDWEALGQVLNGAAYAEQNSLGSLPTNNRDETISGTGILYGSTPVFSKDGQLLGYRTDLTPNEEKEWSNGGPDKTVNKDFGTFITHSGKSHSWNNANWRELSDPTAWQTNAVVGEGGTAFIPKGNEDKLSWTNKDSYQHQDHKMSGFMKVMADITKVADPLGYQIQGGDKFYEQAGKEGLFAALYDKWDPIVSKIDPIHKVIDKPISKALGFDTPKEAFTTIAPIVVAIAAAILTAGAASAAAGAAGGAGSGAAAGGAAATGAATTGAAAGAAGGAAAGAGSGMALAANILNGVNIANSVSKGDFGSALMQLATMGAGTAVGQSFLSSIGDIASDAATAVGIGQGAQGTVASMVKGFFAGDLGAMTGGVISFNPTIDKIIGASVRNAVKSAVVAGVTGAELDHVFATALASGVASLVGGAVGAGTQNVTGSGMLGTVAGTVAGNVAGSAIKDATTEAPGAVQKPTVNKPAAQTPAPAAQSQLNGTGRVARMIWS